MHFISAKCPHCGKEIQLPDDAEQVVCMYCACPIEVRASLQEEKPETEQFRHKMCAAKELMREELIAYRANRQEVNNHGYPEAFEAYRARLAPALRAFTEAAQEGTAMRAAQEYSQFLMEQFSALFERMDMKKNDTRFFDYRYTIVSFLIPAILEQDEETSEALADCFLKRWNEQYPKNPLGKARYEEISKGFRQRLCFITTAVCDSLGRADDCYELNAFRSFRDGWLANAQDGQRKIQEYYLFAPLLVQKINQHRDSAKIYRDIWQTWLRPCLKQLENGEPAACAHTYETMVRQLEQKFLLQ